MQTTDALRPCSTLCLLRDAHARITVLPGIEGTNGRIVSTYKREFTWIWIIIIPISLVFDNADVLSGWEGLHWNPRVRRGIKEVVSGFGIERSNVGGWLIRPRRLRRDTPITRKSAINLRLILWMIMLSWRASWRRLLVRQQVSIRIRRPVQRLIDEFGGEGVAASGVRRRRGDLVSKGVGSPALAVR